jgi:ABC-type lipoprotein export system ATPase subunit
MNTELLTVNHLNLCAEGIDISPDTCFSIKKGRGYLITGPYEILNTFLLKVIGGILPPGTGDCRCEIFFKGKDIYESSELEIEEIKKKISFVFCEGTMISNLSVKENLLLPIGYHCPGFDRNTVMEKIKKGFDFFEIPDVLEKRPAEISYYVKKKLAFIRASLQEPELLLADKPLFNLDENDRGKTVRFLEDMKSDGTTLVVASGYSPDFESLIDEFIILEKGKIDFKTIKGETHEF